MRFFFRRKYDRSSHYSKVYLLHRERKVEMSTSKPALLSFLNTLAQGGTPVLHYVVTEPYSVRRLRQATLGLREQGRVDKGRDIKQRHVSVLMESQVRWEMSSAIYIRRSYHDIRHKWH